MSETYITSRTRAQAFVELCERQGVDDSEILLVLLTEAFEAVHEEADAGVENALRRLKEGESVLRFEIREHLEALNRFADTQQAVFRLLRNEMDDVEPVFERMESERKRLLSLLDDE